MNPLVIDDELVEQCLARVGIVAPYRREPLRAWELSATERVYRTDGASAFLKFARKPLDTEPAVLTHVARHGVPVPSLEGALHHDGLVVMVLEDLGDAVRDANTEDAAAAAVAAHQVPQPTELARLDSAALKALPGSCLQRLGELHAADRWPDLDDDATALSYLDLAATARAEGAELPPFGLCHSEFHPTSLHINDAGWWLLDWARAFIGPGLLDLASWQNTSDAPDLAAFDALVDLYIEAGGAETARAKRGGLPPAQWAFGWHRLWVIDWYLAQATTWIADPSKDPLYQEVIRRHLAEAVECLAPD